MARVWIKPHTRTYRGRYIPIQGYYRDVTKKIAYKEPKPPKVVTTPYAPYVYTPEQRADFRQDTGRLFHWLFGKGREQLQKRKINQSMYESVIRERTQALIREHLTPAFTKQDEARLARAKEREDEKEVKRLERLREQEAGRMERLEKGMELQGKQDLEKYEVETEAYLKRGAQDIKALNIKAGISKNEKEAAGFLRDAKQIEGNIRNVTKTRKIVRAAGKKIITTKKGKYDYLLE